MWTAHRYRFRSRLSHASMPFYFCIFPITFNSFYCFFINDRRIQDARAYFFLKKTFVWFSLWKFVEKSHSELGKLSNRLASALEVEFEVNESGNDRVTLAAACCWCFSHWTFLRSTLVLYWEQKRAKKETQKLWEKRSRWNFFQEEVKIYYTKMTEKLQNFLLINLVVLSLIFCVFASLSGIYIDNGHQTMLQHQLTRDETQEVEHEILDLLGLADRPRRKRHIHPSLRWDLIRNFGG